MSENLSNETTNITDSVVKDIANVLKKTTTDIESNMEDTNSDTNNDTTSSSSFRVCSNNLPANPTVWTKIKNTLFYEIKVELTPYQQKIEDEINEFLHKEITWKSFKDFWMQEVKITL